MAFFSQNQISSSECQIMFPAHDLMEQHRMAILHDAQCLVEHKQFEEAQQILHPLNCIMATWMKGRVYQSAAEHLSNTFYFKYNSTEALIQEYRGLLSNASEYLTQAADMLPSASTEIQEFLNAHIWRQMGSIDNELARTRPVNPPEDEEMTAVEEFRVYGKEMVDSMINEFQFWNVGS